MEGVTPAQVYNQRKHLVYQEMADGLQTYVVAGVAAVNLASGTVNDKVGDISKRYYVTAGGLAVTKPGLTTSRSRSQVPLGIETDALKAAAESRANRRPKRCGPKCRKFRDRNVCKNSQPVGLLAKAWDARFAEICNDRAARKISSWTTRWKSAHQNLDGKSSGPPTEPKVVLNQPLGVEVQSAGMITGLPCE